MKTLLSAIFFACLFSMAYSQVDTISQNLYQLNGQIGVGGVDFDGYFNPRFEIFNGWLQVSNNNNQDAGLVISHEHRSGYGFARTLHMVYEGINGDPFSEFRIRNTDNSLTVTSWAIGAENLNNDKLIISNAINTYTGASPSIGMKVMAFNVTGEVGIGTSDPKARLEVAQGDIYISEINSGVIMRSPDGQCWRGTLDNYGALHFVPVECPPVIVSTYEPTTTSDNIKIFPNPNDGVFTISVDKEQYKDVRYSIFNLNGQQLETNTINGANATIDISGYSAGTYILNVTDGRNRVLSSGKIVKK